MKIPIPHLWFTRWLSSLSVTVFWMASVLIGNLLGFDLNDLQVWACLSMCENDSVITKYWQCFILSQLLQTKILIPVCWCSMFPIRVNSLVMTHPVCHVSKLNRDVITHTLNKTNGSSGPLVIYGLVNSKMTISNIRAGSTDLLWGQRTRGDWRVETFRYPHPYRG